MLHLQMLHYNTLHYQTMRFLTILSLFSTVSAMQPDREIENYMDVFRQISNRPLTSVLNREATGSRCVTN